MNKYQCVHSMPDKYSIFQVFEYYMALFTQIRMHSIGHQYFHLKQNLNFRYLYHQAGESINKLMKKRGQFGFGRIETVENIASRMKREEDDSRGNNGNLDNLGNISHDQLHE